MRPSVRVVHDLVAGVPRGDALEECHRADILRWLESTDDVYRRVRPATPDRHLVAYVVVLDPADGGSLLVDHVRAGLWLPPGGHVEPDEHPRDAALREAREELGIEPVLADETPRFVTVTRTVGRDGGHIDVSLWFVLVGRRAMPLTLDPTEFRGARWWTPAEVAAETRPVLDPHYRRFLTQWASPPDR